MQLSKLLDLDKKHIQKFTLPHVFGDSYLFHYNVIFQRLRLQSLSFGYRYEIASPDYILFPLGHLADVLKTKKIPVIPNTKIMQDIAKQMSGKIDLYELPHIVESHHVHEAAHCIAESLFNEIEVASEKEIILKAMLCESFAITSESLMNQCIHNRAHQVFLGTNSYNRELQGNIDLKHQSLATLGFKNTFMINYFSSLYANFLYKKFPIKDLRKIIRAFGDTAPLNPKSFEVAKELSNISFEFQTGFYLIANPFYFRSMGLKLKGGYQKALDFEFLDLLITDPQWNSIIMQMYEILSGESATQTHSISA